MRAIFLLALLWGCTTYHWHELPRFPLSVPFVQGDSNGEFTATLIQVLARAGFVLDALAPLELESTLIDTQLIPIGYSYEHDALGNRSQSLKVNENRYEWTCRVALKKEGRYIAGPQVLKVNEEFNFQSEELPQQVMHFSISQLTTLDEAIAAARVPISMKMAHAISHWIKMNMPR